MSNNWYCNNCNSWEDSWAENQSYEPTEHHRRDIRCRSCDKWTLIYTDSQKERYKELVKERTSIPGTIYEVERFSTWWSNNIATVIAYYDGYYRVFLLVYDSAYSTYKPAEFPVDKDCNCWGRWRDRGKFNSPSSAKDEAKWLSHKLEPSYGMLGSSPILLLHPYSNFPTSRSFETFVKEPYVAKKYSTSYLKPLDIVKTYMSSFDYYHVGVYLGKIDEEFKVCHFTKKENNTTIDKWSDFLGGEVIGYHPVVPFKSYEDISRQIVWAKDNHFRKRDYHLIRRNCEHLANMLVYGIDLSEQIEQKFKDNKTSICLFKEIISSNVELGRKSDWETEKYETEYLQEVPTKQECRIM